MSYFVPAPSVRTLVPFQRLELFVQAVRHDIVRVNDRFVQGECVVPIGRGRAGQLVRVNVYKGVVTSIVRGEDRRPMTCAM